MNRSTHRRGFAMIIAITMLALAGAAILVITRQFGAEITRTRLSATDAQLRQLLLAAAQDVRDRAREWPPAPAAAQWTIEPATALEQDGAVVSLRSLPLSPTAMQVQIDARIGQRNGGQLLHLIRSPDGWSITDAELGK